MNLIKKVPALIFIKEKSERVPNKNFRLIGNKPLYSIIIDTLRSCKHISHIVLNTDSDEILSKYKNDGFIELQERSHDLLEINSNEANQLISHMIKNVSGDIFFNTHTTNPLILASTIDHFIEKFHALNVDSMFMATAMQSRVWNSSIHPLNFDLKRIIKTQDLEPLFIDNSCGYLFKRKIFLKDFSRLGGKIDYLAISDIEAIDIDTEDQFIIAKSVYEATR